MSVHAIRRPAISLCRGPGEPLRSVHRHGINARFGPALYDESNPDFSSELNRGRDDFSVMRDGESRDIGGVRFQVSRNEDGSYDVTVSAGRVAEFTPWCAVIWSAFGENDTGCALDGGEWGFPASCPSKSEACGIDYRRRNQPPERGTHLQTGNGGLAGKPRGLIRAIKEANGLMKNTLNVGEIVAQKSAAFLTHVDIRELNQRISEFRILNFGAMSYGEVSEAIRNVILFDTPLGKYGMIFPHRGQYPAGTQFYRVRSIPKDDHVLPLRSMSKVGDCWEPPPGIVKMGRLNKAGEPLLYTCPQDPRPAIGELKIPDGERFSLIVYEAIEDINVTGIGFDVNTSDLDPANALKVEMMQGFLRDEFTRDVGRGTEYLYRISETIAKDYFDLPPEIQDAWCFPSMADKRCFNATYRPGTRSKLRLIGVQIAKAYSIEDGGVEIAVDVVAKEDEGSEDLSYHSIGSPEQRRLFPSIITRGGPQSIRR